MYSIYALKDPRNGDVRYVGMSKNPSQRLGQHLSFAFREINNDKDTWIQELALLSLIPTIEILDTVETLDEARQKENHWVRHYVTQGILLTNKRMPVTSRKPPVVGDSPGVKRSRNHYSEFGRLLDALCKEKGMSLHALARASGMKSHASIVRACKRKSKPTREHLLSWCHILECTPEQRTEMLHLFEYATPEELKQPSQLEGCSLFGTIVQQVTRSRTSRTRKGSRYVEHHLWP